MNEQRPELMQESISTPQTEVKRPEISFIIPALNEERLIKETVAQFSQLHGRLEYEVIVSDGGCTDKTVEIAEQEGAKIAVDGAPRKTIASTRNAGAQRAAGELFIFCDADTRFEDVGAFVSRTLEIFKDEKIVAAVPRIEVFPGERTWQDRLFWGFVNRLIYSSFVLGFPFASGQCQVVRQTSFQEARGYDSEQVHGEDSTLMRRMHRVGRLRYIWDATIFESPRRYRKMGYFKYLVVSLYSMVGQALFKRNVLEKWSRVG